MPNYNLPFTLIQLVRQKMAVSPAKTRDEAKAMGLKRYFTASPCAHGHVVERSLRGECIECRRRHADKPETRAKNIARAKQFYENQTPEQRRESRQKWARENANTLRAYQADYFQQNRERIEGNMREWHKRNPGKNAAYRKAAYVRDPARHRAGVTAWEAANPGARRAFTAKRRASQKMATPAWADHKKIAAIYAEAARQGMHVDHEIPLAGESVCGLHVETNLQLLTMSANSAKSNSFESGSFDHPYSTPVLFSA